MAIYRLKRSLTSGELSPLMYGRTDLDVYKNGCKSILNAYIKPQGPLLRRSGTKYLADMTTLFGEEILQYRLVDFVFDETQAYCIIFLVGSTKMHIYFASYDADNDLYGLVDDGSGSPYYLEELVASGIVIDVSVMDYAQSKDVLFIAEGTTEPLQLSRIDHNNWALSTITFTGVPTAWGVNSDYPKRVSFYEQRLVFACTDTYPQHVWFSQSADYFNMLPGSSGSDPIEVQIKSEKHNQIQWLASGEKLFVGSIGDEWSITGNTDYFAADVIRIERHTAKGGQAIRPVIVGGSILFVERLGRSVDEFIYNYETAGYTSVDLSVLAPHLTEEYAISRMAHQAVPNSIVWCVKTDGKVAALTFQREHQVTGWTQQTTEGYFRDVCCTPNENRRETDTWFLIEREIEETPYLYLEILASEFMFQDAEDAWMVDSALDYDEPGVEVSSISGLDHLEGKTVSILTNGAVHADQVVTDGAVELNFSSDRIIVGLPYVSRIIPLPLELSLSDGTSIGRVQRITNMSTFLYRSLGMWVGRDEDEMEEIPFRVPTDLTGQGVPLFTGIKKVFFPEGYDNDTTIIIEQRQPLPMLVISIMDESEVYT